MKIIDLCKEEEDPHIEHAHNKDTDLRSVTRNEIRILQELKGWILLDFSLYKNFNKKGHKEQNQDTSGT